MVGIQNTSVSFWGLAYFAIFCRGELLVSGSVYIIGNLPITYPTVRVRNHPDSPVWEVGKNTVEKWRPYGCLKARKLRFQKKLLHSGKLTLLAGKRTT